MLVSKKYRSPHFEDINIPVEFVILHYTAQTLKGSLDIFLGSKPVSCHLLIDRDGSVYELAGCWGSSCKKAFHAGQSYFWSVQQEKWKNFNGFSIGIELVNWNGNIFPFTEEQYHSLFKVLFHLKKIYPALNNSDRVLGHEHIAGFRGKKDPGYFFDWQRLFREVYKDSQKTLAPVLTESQSRSLRFMKKPKRWNDQKARRISWLMEQTAIPFWLKKLFFRFLM
ncbi:MAG: N-acetylmuramoyl-L-alanine amidase [Oligoflexia bacterium]|nr:N-acetylmuramoyl-L-alanine amidase [Oligoflexia bacterium]